MELVGGRNCLGGDLWNLWRNKRGYFLERRRERGRQAEEEGEASCFVRRRWEGQGMAGKEGKGGILAEVSLPPFPPIYCLWLFCDEREILETVSRSVVLRGKISLCPVFSLIRAFSGRFQTE